MCDLVGPYVTSCSGRGTPPYGLDVCHQDHPRSMGSYNLDVGFFYFYFWALTSLGPLCLYMYFILLMFSIVICDLVGQCHTQQKECVRKLTQRWLSQPAQFTYVLSTSNGTDTPKHPRYVTTLCIIISTHPSHISTHSRYVSTHQRY